METEKPFAILVVDDDPQALEICKVFLESNGHIFFPALNGAEALSLIDIHPFDVVISDVMMPGINGLELCRRIKSDPKTSFLPVVLVTAKGERKDRLRGIEAGCDDFFNKPFDKLEFKARVKSLGRLKRFNEDLEHAEEVLKTLALGVEARDHTTGDHCQRLAVTGAAFARFLQLEQTDIEIIAKAAILHDIGKIAVPDAVLQKNGPLNDEEWKIMRNHPVKGEELLKPLRTASA